MINQSDLLQAKVEVLEGIAVWLVMRELHREPDAVGAAAKMAIGFRSRVEEQAKRLPDTSVSQMAQVIGLEIVDSFFDRVKAAVSAPPSLD